MIFPKLFNHGNLKSIKIDNGKLVMEGTYGKEEFEGGGGGLPEGGYDGQVIMKDQGEAKWLWPLPPGDANTFLKKTSEGNTYAFRAIKEVPDGGNNQDVLTKTASGYMWSPPSGGAGASGNYIEFSGTLLSTIDTTADRVTITSSSFDGGFDFTSITGSPSEGAPVQLSLTIDDSDNIQLQAYLTGMWIDDDDVHCTVCGIGRFSSSPAHMYSITMQFIYDNGQITLDGLYDLILLEKLN